jgi:exopolysaccharide biosynthesis polyprenyl glycosylphosphotransferase
LLRSAIPLGRGGSLPATDTMVPWFLYLLAAAAWAIGLIGSSAYDPHLALRWFNEAWRVIAGGLLATAMMAGVVYLTYRELSRLQFIYFFSVAVLMLLAFRGLLRILYRVSGGKRPGSVNRVLIVGAGEVGLRVAQVLLDHSRWGYRPLGYLDDDPAKTGSAPLGLPVLGDIDRLAHIRQERGVDEIWVALPMSAHHRLQEIIALLEKDPVRVKVIPDYYSMALVQASAEVFGGVPVIGLREPVIQGLPRLLKRSFDLVVTLLLLIPVIPLLAFLALLIRLDSTGPILLRQARVGENGRPFEMFKLRSMKDGNDPEVELEQEVPHKRPNDPRVTRVGRFIRRFSLDELPQLFNVLRGEMSLVGPRPELPWLVDQYDSWQRKRFAVPQGITGWWQINGRSERPMHLNTQDDLYYVLNYSLFLDLVILLRTPVAVLRGTGAF